MAKIVICRKVGFDGDGVIRADTEEQAMKMVAEHAKEVHGIQEVSPEVVEKVRAVMKDE